MLNIILTTVAFIGLARSSGLEDVGLTSVGTAGLELDAPQDSCVVPLDGNVAVYKWTGGGCLLGWTDYVVGEIPHSVVDKTHQPTLSPTHSPTNGECDPVHYGTCGSDLGICPLNCREESWHGRSASKSPKHCNVNKVWFQASGSGSPTDDDSSQHWAGIRLVDSRDYTKTIRSWTKPADGIDESHVYDVVFDKIPAKGCYRLIVQAGSTQHVEISDVHFRMFIKEDEPWKMLVDVDIQFAQGHQIKLDDGNFCLDSPDHWQDNGEVHMWTCLHEDHDNQYWIYDQETGHIKTRDWTYCLDSPDWDRKDGGEVHMWKCQDVDGSAIADQKWIYDDTTGKINLAGTNYCLDSPDRKNDGRVHIWTCYTNSNNQMWTIRKVDGIKLNTAAAADPRNWEHVQGDLILTSSGGYSDPDDGTIYWSNFTVGASYIVDSSDAPTVVTDLYLQPTNGDEVTCPSGYEEKLTIVQDAGDGAENYQEKTGSRKMAFCVQKQACSTGTKYVYEVFALAGGSKELNAAHREGCTLVGHWDPTGAVSYTTGQKGTWTTGIYQCKKDCTTEECASVKIMAMKQTGPPKIDKKANAISSKMSGHTIECDYSGPPVPGGVTTSSQDVTMNSKSYTTDTSISNYFKTTLATNVNVWAEEGFNCWGAEGKVKESFDVQASVSSGFSSKMHRDDTNLHSTTKTAQISETATVLVPAGGYSIMKSGSTQLNYQTQFEAYAQCINKNGEVLETKKITGKFSGQAHAISGYTENFADKAFCDGSEWNCVCDKDENPGTGKQRNLLDRLFFGN